jgi:hypothetical protein
VDFERDRVADVREPLADARLQQQQVMPALQPVAVDPPVPVDLDVAGVVVA